MRTEQLDRTLTALADPTRRAILQRLSKGEARVTEVAAPFNMSLNAISKHVLMLEKATLIKRRKMGRDHFLSYQPKAFIEATEWMLKMRGLWNSRLDTLEELLKNDGNK